MKPESANVQHLPLMTLDMHRVSEIGDGFIRVLSKVTKDKKKVFSQVGYVCAVAISYYA